MLSSGKTHGPQGPEALNLISGYFPEPLIKNSLLPIKKYNKLITF